MKLYYLPGSCALGPHIALEYSGLPYEAVRMERGRQTDPSFLVINPLGRVPALVTATHGAITEAPVVLSYIADIASGLGLLPAVGMRDRYQALRWMAYISTTVHPALGRLWRAARFCDDSSCEQTIERAAATQLADDFAYIERHMSNREWLVGDHLTVADFHLFVFGRLGLRLPASTRNFPSFYRHTLRIARLAATQSAMAQQGIVLEGPPSGPG
ncbi:MAG: glutathione S-transferase N-terminal domain-containing protein [Hyphomicrobiales bacterium]|nr:glutathione S-transferase N-terminal domain-containing protein [Hyphomicrobiales bacterium]MBV8289758.1 glutathione S-transferase N-terminal domain-containing protein [Hyphomicrobiales bacterium]